MYIWPAHPPMRKAATPGKVKIGEKMMTAPNLINIDKLISSNADRLREMGPSTEGGISKPFARIGSTQRTCLHILSAPGDNTSCGG